LVLTGIKLVDVVSVTRKGQATIPKRLREKYGIKGRVLVIEGKEGIILRPVPTPEEDFGSLKAVFGGKSSRELLEDARREEFLKGEERMKRVGAAGLRL